MNYAVLYTYSVTTRPVTKGAINVGYNVQTETALFVASFEGYREMIEGADDLLASLGESFCEDPLFHIHYSGPVDRMNVNLKGEAADVS